MSIVTTDFLVLERCLKIYKVGKHVVSDLIFIPSYERQAILRALKQDRSFNVRPYRHVGDTTKEAKKD